MKTHQLVSVSEIEIGNYFKTSKKGIRTAWKVISNGEITTTCYNSKIGNREWSNDKLVIFIEKNDKYIGDFNI